MYVVMKKINCGEKGVDAEYCACYCDVHPDDENCIGSVVGPHQFPMMVRDLHRR